MWIFVVRNLVALWYLLWDLHIILLNSFFVQNMGVSGSACVLFVTVLWPQKIQDLCIEYPYNEFPTGCIGVGWLILLIFFHERNVSVTNNAAGCVFFSLSLFAEIQDGKAIKSALCTANSLMQPHCVAPCYRCARPIHNSLRLYAD